MATKIRKLKDKNGTYIAPATAARGVFVGQVPISKVLKATLKYTGWTQKSDGSFTQTVQCTGMKTNYNVWDWKAVATETTATNVQIQEAIGLIGTVKPTDTNGYVEVICYSEKPNIEFTLAIRLLSDYPQA